MKNNWGYIGALFLGLILGWLGQQFWSVGKDVHLASSERSLLRNEQRLQQLRTNEPNDVQALSGKRSPKAEANPILNLLIAGHVDEAAQRLINQGNQSSGQLDIALQIAEAWFIQAEYQQLISFLYEFRLFLEPQSEANLLQNIYDLVKLIDTELAEQQRVTELVSIYRLLINLHADYSPYYLRLTHWLIESGDMYQAELSLVAAANDIAYQDEFERLQRKLSQPLQILVPLTKVGDHYTVEVLMGEQSPLNLMIDTGASMTVIKSDIAEAEFSEWLADAQSLRLNTANGQVNGLQFNLPTFTLGSAKLSGIKIGVMPLPNFQFDGLLGMNVLSQFKFSIDQESSFLVLDNQED